MDVSEVADNVHWGYTANFTVRLMGLVGAAETSGFASVSREEVASTPRRLRSLRLALASRFSRAFHSNSCCLRFCDLA